MTEQLSRSEQLKRKRAFWKQHLEGWRTSGLTQKAYCRQHELKDHQFVYWKKRFVQTEKGITFVPVKIHRSIKPPSATNVTSMRLVVDRDFQIEIAPGFDPQLLRRLITTLRSLP